jgi:thioredoxin-related protein
MKNKFVHLSLVTILTLFFTACNDKDTQKTATQPALTEKITPTIPWVKDMPTAFELAKKEHKDVMIMVVSEGCRWCEKMKEETLSDERVLKKLEKYILVQADRETPSERSQLPEFNHVPVIFFMSPHKEVIDDLRGYFPPNDFLEYLDEIESS